MLYKTFATATLVSAAYAQGNGLTAALAGIPQASSLVGLLPSVPGITETLSSLSNITLLAPSNYALGTLLNSSAGAALASSPGLLQAVLTYHVLNGTYPAEAVQNSPAFLPSALTNTTYTNVTGGQRVGAARANNNVTFFSGLLRNSTAVQANVNFQGGVIHVIDHVLTLPANVSRTLVSAGLSSLYGALNTTGLLSTVEGLKDVTIFAPNNAAFSTVGSALEKASVDTLKSVLTYHVVQGAAPVYSSDIVNGTSVSTVNGANITLRSRPDGSVFVNGAKVLTPNVLIAGGVVHVIDNLLNPNATGTGSGQETATTGVPAFSGATSVPNAPFTSGVPSATPTGNSTSRPTGTASKAGAAPMITGAVGMGALFGAGAVLANI